MFILVHCLSVTEPVDFNAPVPTGSVYYQHKRQTAPPKRTRNPTESSVNENDTNPLWTRKDSAQK